jgi:hypothetical protein
MIPARITVLIAMTFLAARAGAGEALREPRKVAADASARIAKLRAEIAALDAQARGDSPKFEAELREWEARMAEPSEWSDGKGKKQVVPERIAKILGIEPSERTDQQRAAITQYFRPLSKTVAAALRALAAKRAELAALRRAWRRKRGSSIDSVAPALPPRFECALAGMRCSFVIRVCVLPRVLVCETSRVIAFS